MKKSQDGFGGKKASTKKGVGLSKKEMGFSARKKSGKGASMASPAMNANKAC